MIDISICCPYLCSSNSIPSLHPLSFCWLVRNYDHPVGFLILSYFYTQMVDSILEMNPVNYKIVFKTKRFAAPFDNTGESSIPRFKRRQRNR